MRTIILASFLLLCLTLLSSQPLLAAPRTSVLEDPEGDTFLVQGAPDYMDLIRGEVSLQSGIFLFKFEVAGPVPDEPDLEPPGMVISWEWLLDTDPATFPSGFPVPPGFSDRVEFDILVLWDGTQFDAILVDRRPSLFGEEVIVTPIPFNIEGNELSVSVSRRMMDKPKSFVWGGLTAIWSAAVDENFSIHPADAFAGNLAAGTWPPE